MTTTNDAGNDVKDPLLPTFSTREIDPETLDRKGLIARSVSATSVSRAIVASESTETNPWASLVNGLYNGTSNLSNLLPTGTYLAFSAIAPVITDSGTCDTPTELGLSIFVLLFFAVFCVVSCFTDSYQALDGKVYYGIVTVNGLWTPQLPEALHPGDKQQYKITITDVIHAVLSLAVFMALGLMTPSVRTCFYPDLSDSTVRIVPAFVGFFVSAIFVSFPSARRGIGFPVSPASLMMITTGRDFSIDNVQED